MAKIWHFFVEVSDEFLFKGGNERSQSVVGTFF